MPQFNVLSITDPKMYCQAPEELSVVVCQSGIHDFLLRGFFFVFVATGKYREFHKMYEEGKLQEAGHLLISLLTSKLAPQR